MFDSLLDGLADVATALAASSAEQLVGVDSCAAVRRLQQAGDQVAVVQMRLMAVLEHTRAYEDDGASTVAAWARRELRLTPAEALSMTAAGRTIDALPAVAASAAAGRIRLAHLTKLSYGLKHIGPEPMDAAQDTLVQVAETHDPAELFAFVKALREKVFPDSLDEAWVRGMDKRDVRADPVPDGWHVSGFLDTVTGARLHQVLASLSAPSTAEDTSTTAERRVTGLDALLRGYLEHGLPTDKGIRPQLHVIVDHDALSTAATGAGDAVTTGDGGEGRGEAAQLSGFGPIGPQLLSMLSCEADITAVSVHDTKTHRQVLNVGRTHRLATPAQRTAVMVRQDGICAVPGCTHTHLDIHHVQWWSRGGRTDIDNLVGVCPRCHFLAHRGLLTITADEHGGFTFTRATGWRLHDHQRNTRQRTRRRLRHLDTPSGTYDPSAGAAADRGPGDPARQPSPSPVPLRATTRPSVRVSLKTSAQAREVHPPRPHRRT